jgi:hypothetical protein
VRRLGNALASALLAAAITAAVLWGPIMAAVLLMTAGTFRAVWLVFVEAPAAQRDYNRRLADRRARQVCDWNQEEAA